MKNKLLMVLSVILAVSLFPAISLSKSTEKGVTELSEDNLVYLNAEVNGDSVGKAIDAAREIAGKTRLGKCKINLVLYTPGGSVESGLELREALKGTGCEVTTITQFAASMGFQLAQAFGKRLIIESGTLMSHHATGEFSGQFGGESSQVRSRLGLWEARMNELDQIAATRAGKTLAEYQHAYTPELWVTGQQAVKEKYADELTTLRCDSSLDGVTSHSTMIMGMIPVTYDLDKCPINTSPKNIKISMPTNRGLMDADRFLELGGEFGTTCIKESVTNPQKLCAEDTGMSRSKIREIKDSFKSQYNSDMHQVVDKF